MDDHQVHIGSDSECDCADSIDAPRVNRLIERGSKSEKDVRHERIKEYSKEGIHQSYSEDKK